MSKKKKTETIEPMLVSERVEGSYLDLEGDLDSAIKALTEAREEFGSRYESLYLDNQQDCGCYGNCGCSPRLVLYGRRMETDGEFAIRKQRFEDAKAREEAQARAQFEALSKRFAKA